MTEVNTVRESNQQVKDLFVFERVNLELADSWPAHQWDKISTGMFTNNLKHVFIDRLSIDHMIDLQFFTPVGRTVFYTFFDTYHSAFLKYDFSLALSKSLLYNDILTALAVAGSELATRYTGSALLYSTSIFLSLLQAIPYSEFLENSGLSAAQVSPEFYKETLRLFRPYSSLGDSMTCYIPYFKAQGINIPYYFENLLRMSSCGLI